MPDIKLCSLIYCMIQIYSQSSIQKNITDTDANHNTNYIVLLGKSGELGQNIEYI